MGSARADWHAPARVVDDRDPFETVIDVTDTAPDRRLVDLIEEEGRLFDAGTRCEIKDRADTCCHACPVNRSTEASPAGRLCAIGIAQERLLTRLAADRRGA